MLNSGTLYERGASLSILITGASGHLGRRLLARLAGEGEECVALTRNPNALPLATRHVLADMQDPGQVQAAIRSVRPRVVYHCAMSPGHPTCSRQRLESLQTCVIGTAALAEASAECGVERFVFTGSFLMYQPQKRALMETDPIGPRSLRGAAKAGASLWLGQFAAATGFPAIELRIFSVYGPGEAAPRFIPTVLRAARHATPLPLLPLPSHDFVHVDDVVDAALLAATAPAPAGAVFNIAGGRAWRNEEVVDAAVRALGKPIAVNRDAYPPRPADDAFWLADISSAEAVLGWKPKYSLEAGLRQTDEETCRGLA